VCARSIAAIFSTADSAALPAAVAPPLRVQVPALRVSPVPEAISPAIPPHRWLTAIAVMSSAVMQLLDTSVVNHGHLLPGQCSAGLPYARGGTQPEAKERAMSEAHFAAPGSHFS
jgi:hypothetical protein